MNILTLSEKCTKEQSNLTYSNLPQYEISNSSSICKITFDEQKLQSEKPNLIGFAVLELAFFYV